MGRRLDYANAPRSHRRTRRSPYRTAVAAHFAEIEKSILNFRSITLSDLKTLQNYGNHNRHADHGRGLPRNNPARVVT